MARREAEVRVALRGVSGKHALLLHAEIVGDDLYYGSSFRGLRIRASYHRDGKSHVYAGAERMLSAPAAPLRSLRGKVLLGGASVSDLPALDWSYTPVADRKHRRSTLILDLEHLKDPLSISLWGVERNHPELVREILDDRLRIAVAHVLADWSQPQLLAVAWKLGDEVREALDQAAKRATGATQTTWSTPAWPGTPAPNGDPPK